MTPQNADYPIIMQADRYTDGRPCWIAQHPDLPGAIGYGETKEMAEARLAAAREALLERLQAGGKAAPKPEPARPVQIVWPTAGTAGSFIRRPRNVKATVGEVLEPAATA